MPLALSAAAAADIKVWLLRSLRGSADLEDICRRPPSFLSAFFTHLIQRVEFWCQIILQDIHIYVFGVLNYVVTLSASCVKLVEP